MMHVISIPYSLMKVNPLSWIQKVCQYKGKEQECTKVYLNAKSKEQIVFTTVQLSHGSLEIFPFLLQQKLPV